MESDGRDIDNPLLASERKHSIQKSGQNLPTPPQAEEYLENKDASESDKTHFKVL